MEQVSKVVAPRFPSLRPVNDFCIDCNKKMRIDARQELAFDLSNQPRRRCFVCMKQQENK